jgi:hypothetical protein
MRHHSQLAHRMVLAAPTHWESPRAGCPSSGWSAPLGRPRLRRWASNALKGYPRHSVQVRAHRPQRPRHSARVRPRAACPNPALVVPAHRMRHSMAPPPSSVGRRGPSSHSRAERSQLVVLGPSFDSPMGARPLGWREPPTAPGLDRWVCRCRPDQPDQHSRRSNRARCRSMPHFPEPGPTRLSHSSPQRVLPTLHRPVAESVPPLPSLPPRCAPGQQIAVAAPHSWRPHLVWHQSATDDLPGGPRETPRNHSHRGHRAAGPSCARGRHTRCRQTPAGRPQSCAAPSQ